MRCTLISAKVRKIVLGNRSYTLNIAAAWITTDNTQLMRPNMTSNTDVTYYAVTFWEPVLFSEFATEAGWGTLYYAMKTVRLDVLARALLTIDGPGEQCHIHTWRKV